MPDVVFILPRDILTIPCGTNTFPNEQFCKTCSFQNQKNSHTCYEGDDTSNYYVVDLHSFEA